MYSFLINGIEYIKKELQQSEAYGDYKIVCLQRGWVMVGKLEKIGTDCKLHNSYIIRNWGTTKGLGEIAKDGPTNKTVLDACNGLVEFDYLTVVATISIEVSNWKNQF